MEFKVWENDSERQMRKGWEPQVTQADSQVLSSPEFSVFLWFYGCCTCSNTISILFDLTSGCKEASSERDDVVHRLSSSAEKNGNTSDVTMKWLRVQKGKTNTLDHSIPFNAIVNNNFPKQCYCNNNQKYPDVFSLGPTGFLRPPPQNVHHPSETQGLH